MDLICHNGIIGPLSESGAPPLLFDEQPYLYQRMHTRNHRIWYPELHLELLNQALNAVYGVSLELPVERLQELTETLLTANHYPRQGHCVTLRVYPRPQQQRSEYLLTCTEQLYYPKYTVWHKRLMLTVMPCEYLFMGYSTSISCQIAHYSRNVAEREGCERAVIENMNGVLTNVEDEPLFVVADRRIFTSPLSEGTVDSVMRRLIFQACRREKIECIEMPLKRNLLNECDEVFTASPQGLLSFEGFGRTRYFNLMVKRLIPHLNDPALLTSSPQT